MFARSWAAARLRLWFGVVCAVLVLAACGGGGGDGGEGGTPLFPAPPVLQGDWQLTVTAEGVTSPPVAVPADAVPSASEVSGLTAASLAQISGNVLFQGTYTVTTSGNTITVTDPDTNYALTINSLSTSAYQDCGTCAVGSEVSFNVNMNYTEQGTFDGQAVPHATDSLVMTLRYRRVT